MVPVVFIIERLHCTDVHVGGSTFCVVHIGVPEQALSLVPGPFPAFQRCTLNAGGFFVFFFLLIDWKEPGDGAKHALG